MSDKSTVIRGFNSLFFEFIHDIISIFPENKDLKDALVAFEFFKKANPTSIIKSWHFFVYQPYKETIESGDISFFFEKDYKSDLSSLSNSDEIMRAIDRIREPVKQMNESNKKKASVYVKNLSRLSQVYSLLT